MSVAAIVPAAQGARTLVFIVAIAAILAGANLAIGFPGVSGPDSQSQYQQVVTGQFDDWHPPIMAWLWSAFRLVADGDAPMFCFQVVFYWLGFGLIAAALARAGRPVAAWAVLSVALFPPLLTTNVIVLKDVGMAVTFLAAVAVVFWYRVQDREPPRSAAAVAFVLLLYGLLVRTNAVFAAVPLFVYVVRPRWLARPWRLLAMSLPVVLAMVPASDLVNHRILGAESLREIRALQMFDIAGVAFYSGDLTVLGPDNSFTRAEVDSCYQPFNWDPLSPWGDCRFFWNRLAVPRDWQSLVEQLDARPAMSAPSNPDLSSLWVAAILAHPLSYATHRVANFGSQIGILDGRRAAVMALSTERVDESVTVPKPLGLLLYDVVTTPALWLAIGACLLVQLASARPLRRSASFDLVLALLLSGMPYALAFGVIGVASEYRYLLWSLGAVLVALVMSLEDLTVPLRRRAATAA